MLFRTSIWNVKFLNMYVVRIIMSNLLYVFRVIMSDLLSSKAYNFSYKGTDLMIQKYSKYNP